MTAILALDIATRAGWAFWRPGMEKPRCGTLQMKEGDPVGRWLWPLDTFVRDFIQVEPIDEIAIESPVPQGSETKVLKLCGGAALVMMIAEQHRIHCELVPNGTMVVHWLGTARIPGDQRKDYSICAAKLHGWNVSVHDEADALGVLVTRLHQRRVKTPFDVQPAAGPLFEGNGAKPVNTAAVNKLANAAMRMGGANV